MSYNGIGLRTARGSGTSGHVQNNLASISDEVKYEEFIMAKKRKVEMAGKDEVKGEFEKENKKILLDHKSMRQIELQCMELRVELEEADVGDEEIENRVELLRRDLKEQLHEDETKGEQPEKQHEDKGQIREKPESDDGIKSSAQVEVTGTDVYRYIPLGERKIREGKK
ncbi:pre-mRNA-splicing factor Cwc21p [[Candida] jaroonii]|uniref:Pre-mRNA-splicing factor Cwc21p n=1 Tax=[Candida] jaroonii TaxID=467808 RepID=A0ACA9YEI7_9ASCO|nr:pre-mRNA-splicing factor Cwc21p [[Candida] jaroonii]